METAAGSSGEAAEAEAAALDEAAAAEGATEGAALLSSLSMSIPTGPSRPGEGLGP